MAFSKAIIFFFVFVVACMTAAAGQELDLAPAPAPSMDSAASYPAAGAAVAFVSMFVALLWH
ncbi:hypothetical protein DCAR_0102101 [Daucus carota subsp. sativus]|uniref:Uncharacterized protein n=1 Tax=Daucus carota subsp. sativus TaxID=79200 RepID=A0A162B330_DAUCS|nr:hypothetical protein DCAR_0102101 [Daucus carota subsp. sativus]